MAESNPILDHYKTGLVEFGVRAGVAILREPRRAKCSVCLRRREVYRVRVTALAGAPDTTDARCAPCWGIRE